MQAGDAYYSPAGTIHSIGGGLTLLEVQQNCDVTYRLYDFGRPRELHLDEGVAAARPDTSVLYMSGYSDDAILRHGVRKAAAHFIQKPFSIDALAHKIRETLNAASNVPVR